MNRNNKLYLLSAGFVVAMSAAPAQAQVVILEQSVRANAVEHCDAFTPGISNTIRNRVVGSENVGTAPIAVACAFSSENSTLDSLPKRLTLFFSNNSATPFTMNCTMLTGYQGQAGAYAVNKTVLVPAMSQSTQFITYQPADLPVPFMTTLGNGLVGVNCTLPPGAVINETVLWWDSVIQ